MSVLRVVVQVGTEFLNAFACTGLGLSPATQGDVPAETDSNLHLHIPALATGKIMLVKMGCFCDDSLAKEKL